MKDIFFFVFLYFYDAAERHAPVQWCQIGLSFAVFLNWTHSASDSSLFSSFFDAILMLLALFDMVFLGLEQEQIKKRNLNSFDETVAQVDMIILYLVLKTMKNITKRWCANSNIKEGSFKIICLSICTTIVFSIFRDVENYITFICTYHIILSKNNKNDKWFLNSRK